VILAIKRHDFSQLSLFFKYDFIDLYIYRYIYWPYLIEDNENLSFRQFKLKYSIDQALRFKLAVTLVEPF